MSIGKLKKGEKIVIMRISEPLQEQFDEMTKLSDDMKWAVDEARKLERMNVPIPEEKKAHLHRTNALLELKSKKFWFDVNEQYNLWAVGMLGIRDGYCIVKGPEMPDPREFTKKLRKFIKDELGDHFGLVGPGDEEEDEDNPEEE